MNKAVVTRLVIAYR